MKVDELLERLETIKDILTEMDNAATPDLIEAIEAVKDIIAGKVKDTKKQLSEDLVKFNTAFDDVFNQFLLQLFKDTVPDDKRFKK